jgi:hypothetical protein
MPNWGSGATGALGGAATGSAFGPIGAGIGGVVGGLAGLFGGGKEKKPKIKNHSILSPQQQQALNRYFSSGIETSPLYQQGSSYLQNILSNSPGSFEAFEAPYRQNFEEFVVPSITERFAGMGTGAGALNSSGLQNALAQAGRSLTTDLAGLRAGLQGQAANQAIGYAQQPYSNLLSGLGIQPFQPYERPVQPGFLSQSGAGLFGGTAQGLGSKFGDFLGNRLFGEKALGTPGA